MYVHNYEDLQEFTEQTEQSNDRLKVSLLCERMWGIRGKKGWSVREKGRGGELLKTTQGRGTTSGLTIHIPSLLTTRTGQHNDISLPNFVFSYLLGIRISDWINVCMRWKSCLHWNLCVNSTSLKNTVK